MAGLNPQRLLESVVRITKHRDQHSLETNWVDTMLELLDAGEVSLYRFTDSGKELEEVAHAVRGEHRCVGDQCDGYIDPEQDPALKQCLDEALTTMETRDGAQRLIYPVLMEGRVVGALSVVCNRVRQIPDNDRLIIGFLRIYQNYLAILDDSERDTLTGLLNRKTFDERIGAILRIAQERAARPAEGSERRVAQASSCHWLGILDIDHFKAINDTYGHLYGDEVLLLFSQIMRRTFRSRDLLFRYGGEEFVVVLAPTDMNHAQAAFERFRRTVEEFDFPQVGRVTVSVGMVKIGTQDIPSAVVGHADQALYYAKEHGRNRVCSFERLREQGALRLPEAEQAEVEFF